jgi:hypothetical protein
MGVNTEAHRSRIVTFVTNITRNITTGVCEEVVKENQIWFVGLVLTVLLVIWRSAAE